jgi:tetratricopeptide (TPR) repeat protein/TolB-like protein
MSRRLFILAGAIALLLCSCASETGGPILGQGDQTDRLAGRSVFRHRWWNYYERGVFYAERGLFEEALADLGAALKQRDRDQRMARTYGMHYLDYFPQREMGIVYYDLGDLDAAQKHLTRSVEQYPSAKAHYYLDQVRRKIISESGKEVAPPELVLDVNEDMILTREDPVLLRGTAIDDHFIQAVSINNTPLLLEYAQRKVVIRTELSLPQGVHPVHIRAVNLAGKITERNISVTVDRQGPVIVVEQITRPYADQSPGTYISGFLVDPSQVVSASVNTEPLRLEPEVRQAFTYTLPAGVNTLSIEARDRLGNITQAEFTLPDEAIAQAAPSLLLAASDLKLCAELFTSNDRRPPRIELKGWSDPQTVYLDRIFLNGVVMDDNIVAKIMIDGESIDSGGYGKIVIFNKVVTLKEGANLIEIEAQDRAGNRSKTAIVVSRRIPEALQLDVRLKVTVLPFDKNVSAFEEAMMFHDYFIDALVGQQRFRVVERHLLEMILQEHRLSASELVDRKTAIKLGQLAAAQSIIAGSILKSRHGVEIVSRMIDTETSDIIATVDVYGELTNRIFARLAEGMALKYHSEFPLSGGMVLAIDGKNILTDLGRQNIKLQRCLILYLETPVKHPLNDRIIGTDKQIMGRARVIQVDENISKAIVLTNPVPDIKNRYKVIAE